GLLHRNAKTAELVMAVALADAEIEPAAGNQIKGGGLLCKQHPIVPGQHDDGAAQTKPRGAHGERGLQPQGGGDLVPAREMVLDQEAGTKAKRLCLDRVIKIFAEPLPGLGAEIVAVGLCRAEYAELHRRSLRENKSASSLKF